MGGRCRVVDGEVRIDKARHVGRACGRVRAVVIVCQWARGSGRGSGPEGLRAAAAAAGGEADAGRV